MNKAQQFSNHSNEFTALLPQPTNNPGRLSFVPTLCCRSTKTKTAEHPPMQGATLLPPDFVPTNYSVICGRGKGFYNACGNRRLRIIVGTLLQQYIDAKGAPTKRAGIVRKVVNIMKECCPVGAFIQCYKGRYYEVPEKTAWEKCSSLFRDCLRERSPHSGTLKQAKQQIKNRSVVNQIQAASSTFNVFVAYQGEMKSQAAMKTNHNRPVAKRRRLSGNDASIGSFYDVETTHSLSLVNIDDGSHSSVDYI